MPDDVPSTINDEDAAKYEGVYRLYQPRMPRLAYRLLRNAQDAVQDAFLSVANHLDQFSQPESPKTRGYIMVITERKAIDILRGRQRRAYEE